MMESKQNTLIYSNQSKKNVSLTLAYPPSQ